MNLNFVQLERELTDYFAGKLGLVVDNTLFRGQIPEAVGTGAAVLISNSPENNDFSLPSVSVQVIGKYRTRDEALQLASACGFVPVYGEQTEHYDIRSVHSEGGINAPFVIDDKGKLMFTVSVNFSVDVLTR